MALLWKNIKHLYCPKTGLKLAGYSNARQFLVDLIKIEIFGSVEKCIKYDADFYNSIRHERDKKTRRDEFGNTSFYYKTEMLKLLIAEGWKGPNGHKEYCELRDRQAKENYFKRGKENGRNEKIRLTNKERRHTDPEYREHLYKRQRALVDADPERHRQYKRNWELNNTKYCSDTYFQETYGESWKAAKEVWNLELTLRKLKKEGIK